MTNYIKIDEITEIYFPVETDLETIQTVWVNNQTNREYNIDLLVTPIQRGFTSTVIVTGEEAELDYVYSENYYSEINIPVGDYTVTCNDSDGIERITMIHISKDSSTDTYTTENENIIYNG
jgi:hypothetical protein